MSAPGDPGDGKQSANIASLEARIAVLEKRLERLEQGAPLVMSSPRLVPMAGTPLGGSAFTVPPQWKQGEINGMPYYVIPLQGESSAKRAD